MRPSTRRDHDARIRRVIAHVDANLGGDLSLERLARVACLSPYHFHRIFRAMTGEPLHAYVQRRRLEHAARALDADPSAGVLSVALSHGYTNASAFARAFRAHFGMHPTAWRRAEGEAHRARLRASRRSRGELRKFGTDRDRATWKKMAMSQRLLADQEHASPRVEALPPSFALAKSYVGPYRADEITRTWSELLTLADELGLVDEETVCIGVRHDDPAITEPRLCRYDACVVVPEGTDPHELSTVALAGGTYLVAPFVGSPDQVEAAWDDFYARAARTRRAAPRAPSLEWYPPRGILDPERPRFRCNLCLAV